MHDGGAVLNCTVCGYVFRDHTEAFEKEFDEIIDGNARF